jgi:hypothetical protein
MHCTETLHSHHRQSSHHCHVSLDVDGYCAVAGGGFDTRVSRESGMLGQGAYFAWAASYSLEGYARRVHLPA